VKHKLMLTLEELYNGTSKRMKITRTRLDESGQPQLTNKIVEIPVKAGWKAGTKITFEKEGDERPGEVPADIIFQVEEQTHPRFIRSGNDLIHKRAISLTQALVGTRIQVEHLDKTIIEVDTSQIGVIYPGYRKVIRARGMPIAKQPNTFGDFIVDFDVQFPKGQLTNQQKQKILEAHL